MTWFYNKNFLAEHAELIRGSVLDAGCGEMKYKQMLLGCPGVKEYIGLDYYSKGVDVVADLNADLPLPSDRFDTIISISVLEHLLEPQHALNELFRVMKPGGRLLLSTPWIFPYHGYPNDYFRYSRAGLLHLLKKAGFESEYCVSTGGKMRIISTMCLRWFPPLKRFSRQIDGLMGKLSPQKVNEGAEILNTPSHHVIAVKPLA